MSEDVHDQQFGNHLNSYYDEVLTVVLDAESIQIFGPGEAKGELEKHLEHAGLKGKMADRQIAAKVRDHLAT